MPDKRIGIGRFRGICLYCIAVKLTGTRYTLREKMLPLEFEHPRQQHPRQTRMHLIIHTAPLGLNLLRATQTTSLSVVSCGRILADSQYLLQLPLSLRPPMLFLCRPEARCTFVQSQIPQTQKTKAIATLTDN